MLIGIIVLAFLSVCFLFVSLSYAKENLELQSLIERMRESNYKLESAAIRARDELQNTLEEFE